MHHANPSLPAGHSLSTGEALAERLFRVETAIDAALSEAAALVSELPRARTEAYLSAVVGQQIFDRTTESLTALTQARARMVAAHHGLAALARKMGLGALAVGPLDKPEDTPPIGDGPRGALRREHASTS